jgi:sulfur-oxidizing protein SoxX
VSRSVRAAAVVLAGFLTGPAAAEGLKPFAVAGDSIPAPLTGANGDAARGRAIVGDRQVGFCLLCHPGPIPEEPLQGTIGPDLRGVGSRLSEGQIRLRVVDQRRVNPDTIMPPFYRMDGLIRVPDAYRGRPILTAGQIEDVVAYLATLTE